MQSLADIKKAAKVLELARAGVSHRLIARQIGLSKNTVEANCDARSKLHHDERGRLQCPLAGVD